MAQHRLNIWQESSRVGLPVIFGGFLFPAENLLDLFYNAAIFPE
jgi:hypothetical protein